MKKGETDGKLKLQTCSAYQVLHTLQFWSKSDYPSWSYCPFFHQICKMLILFVLILVLDGSDIKIALYCLWNRGSQVEPGINNISRYILSEINFEMASIGRCKSN
jgi:hypothetical protein